MSLEDRLRWNQRYAEGSYSDRAQPTQILKEWLDLLPFNGIALDVACGLGRNTRFLAQQNYEVTGLDISDLAIAKAKELSHGTDLAISYLVCDLDDGIPIAKKYDLITIIRFVDRQLLREIHGYLRPGGMVAVEVHMVFEHDRPLVGPKNQNFRVFPGELADLLGELTPIKHFEGLIVEPDGREAAVARILARKPQM